MFHIFGYKVIRFEVWELADYKSPTNYYRSRLGITVTSLRLLGGILFLCYLTWHGLWLDVRFCLISAQVSYVAFATHPINTMVAITGSHNTQNPRWTQKLMYTPIFTHHIRSWLICTPVIVVTQIRGHIAGSSPPFPLRYIRALHSCREKDSAPSSLVDSRRIVPTYAATGALDSWRQFFRKWYSF